ncbi:hypothetical protein C6T65_21045 [Burkholderia vietnamiensis]|uniref:Uncharacterized protein n=1 Tax=Burkholderia vietnamiensis TaxID=60552 RepID=A0AA45BC28_BURVI|nr:hypothetical protein C6T65_21045 [Burkholderia vietnamiensis]
MFEASQQGGTIGNSLCPFVLFDLESPELTFKRGAHFRRIDQIAGLKAERTLDLVGRFRMFSFLGVAFAIRLNCVIDRFRIRLRLVFAIADILCARSQRLRTLLQRGFAMRELL